MATESREAESLNSDIREQAAQYTLAANPLVGVRGHDILASAGVLVGQMMKNPGSAAQQYFSFVGELGRILIGGSELAPDAKDKRFAASWRNKCRLACAK